MKKLPIGISTLANLRNEDYIYVDKTPHLAKFIASGGKYYFLSRPRRFGKSLLVDTIKQAFLAKKELFTGLYLEHNWDWSKAYPVIHFDFGEGVLTDPQALEAKINKFLDKYYTQYAINDIYQEISGRFSYLITELGKKYGQVVLLIDEYDKPILDNITNPAIAIEMREGLKNLYSVIKTQDANLKFVLLTGVSKFSKVSLFSGLNNLQDISLSARYADICGYTQQELEREFKAYLADGKVDLIQLKRWYNGYNFAGSEEQKVYNPFDILLFCGNDYNYRSYWFETATPTFLVRLLESKQYYIPNLEAIEVLDSSLSSFDVDNIAITALLFQTGYLTIKEITTIGTQYAYVLSYPNQEVKASLNGSLAEIGANMEIKNQHLSQLGHAIKQNNFSQIAQIFSSHFASIPHEWYRNNNIAHYEGFYASIVYSYLAALGYPLTVEDSTNHGKIDLVMNLPDKILLIEFKLNKYGSAKQALEQIKQKQYPQKYQAENKPIHLLGMSFDPIKRNVDDFVCENYPGQTHIKLA